MVSVPVRDEEGALAATEKPVVPFPLPLLPEVMEIQAALLEALQEQPLKEVTVVLPAPPPELIVRLVGERE